MEHENTLVYSHGEPSPVSRSFFFFRFILKLTSRLSEHVGSVGNTLDLSSGGARSILGENSDYLD